MLLPLLSVMPEAYGRAPRRTGPEPSVNDGRVLLLGQRVRVLLLLGPACLFAYPLPITRVETTLMTKPAITTPPAMSPIIAGPSRLFRTTPLR